MTMLATATTTSIRFIGSRSSLKAIVHRVGGGSDAILFSPCSARREPTTAVSRPRSTSTSSAADTSSGAMAYQGRLPVIRESSVIVSRLSFRQTCRSIPRPVLRHDPRGVWRGAPRDRVVKPMTHRREVHIGPGRRAAAT
ncbi:hypothetical protein BN12_40020 [Nostocoides japonicum T1-X7]|uniref:Uncharacterized protein n=1 Tax=Nostocoides japonicum T1-X7 TaxID=1194083 RepID=A0A077M4K0_9MICO|nr:hypothetical protein BN12_40020 [Tetrasphaera japonica T1-X7]